MYIKGVCGFIIVFLSLCCDAYREYYAGVFNPHCNTPQCVAVVQYLDQYTSVVDLYEKTSHGESVTYKTC